MKAQIFAGWNFEIPQEFDTPVELYVDTASCYYKHDTRAFKVLFVCEPPEIMPQMVDYAIRNHSKYNLVLTYNEKILSMCKNAKLFLYGTTWIHNDYEVEKNKEFEVSTLVGFKQMTLGHRMRHELWRHKNKIKVPKKFYMSQHGGPEHPGQSLMLGDSKYPLFDSQFHIVIENASMRNMFTEKVMDCFQTKTVPIMWGCPNIGDFFDVRGIYVASSVDHIIEICNLLDDTIYEKMKPYVDANYETSKNYANLYLRLGDIIQSSIIDKKR